MKRVMGGLLLFIFAWWPGSTIASELNIINPSICKNILSRQPVDAGEIFESNVHKLFCMTRVVGPYHVDKEQYVVHVWYYQEEERARVTLPVKSSNWGTFSSKIINPHEIGSWHVDVFDPQNEKIKTLPFSIR